MSDLNWCTYCDNAVSAFSNSLYCSEECLRADALNHHPLLGYDWQELKNFPRSNTSSVTSPSLSSSASSVSSASSPALSPIPSYTLPSPKFGSSHNYYHHGCNSHHQLSPPAIELGPSVKKLPNVATSPSRRSQFFI
ncbi:hypothetical protein BCR43DRAFT_486076 [Syncephalastrum racemosum]|uniref:Uncharacterized protein n=1 Tax=Syncephalastrum racemosum TaxID=13706 RepID=A0A1X2HNK4_SYNRA|nr:hypothetical protein BCR43DRAFT_486076 [Syncephalastrum racemosum]